MALPKSKPFLKWVGGKSQLVNEIDQLIGQVVQKTNKNLTYIEPFVGGGAILFHVLNNVTNIENFIINDINRVLVNAYKAIQKNHLQLIDLLLDIQSSYYSLNTLEEKRVFYLEKRKVFNFSSEDQLIKIALLIFLNKTCFNGLYRVNKQGKFNVPFGKYLKPTICDIDNLSSVHQFLQRVNILNGDFQETLEGAVSPSLFYLDPPYKPIKLTSSFTSYSQGMFNDQEQIRLKLFCDEINKNNHYFILSNSDVKNYDSCNNFFDELYQQYKIKRVKARRSINSQGDKRGEVFELIITNF
ncbi:MAG: Dam family site-specific DNA-(adenine-N6)-methyltransferase [Cyanobacterium sp. T60_A2020_053]|nr:Dam family site-specific DNA-(adenine-N6)-methyltransferase [Cyanobacterium sp. T60_A2020_053]